MRRRGQEAWKGREGRDETCREEGMQGWEKDEEKYKNGTGMNRVKIFERDWKAGHEEMETGQMRRQDRSMEGGRWRRQRVYERWEDRGQETWKTTEQDKKGWRQDKEMKGLN